MSEAQDRIPKDLTPPIATQEAAEKYAERWFELEVAQRHMAEVRAAEQNATVVLTGTVAVKDASRHEESTAPPRVWLVRFRLAIRVTHFSRLARCGQEESCTKSIASK